MSSGTGSLAAVTAGSMISPCCCGCWSRFGDTMEGVVTGVLPCGCFSDTDPNPPGTTRYWSPSNLVGVNGPFSLTALLPGDPNNTQWQAITGTVDLQEYDGSVTRPSAICDGTPIGDPITVNVVQNISCVAADNGGLVADIRTEIGGPLFGLGAAIFSSTAGVDTFQPGDVVPNVLTCTLDGADYFIHVAAEGQLTVTAP